ALREIALAEPQDSLVRQDVLEGLAGWKPGRPWFRRLHVPESASNPALIRIIDVGSVVNAVALFVGDGRAYALSASNDYTLRWWALDSGRCLYTLEGHTGGVLAVALSGDGRRALSASWDRTVRWWDLERGECRLLLRGHTGGVTAVALSGDGRLAL